MGDLSDLMVNRLSYEIGLTLGASTSPTATEAVAWLNDGALLIATLLYTAGKFDKINALIESEEKINGAGGAVVTLGNATLPSTNDAILFYHTIEFSVGAGAYKPAKLLTFREVIEDRQKSFYGATSSHPICAFGDGVMIYSPTAGASPIDRVKYTFVEKPTLMVVTTTETFPFSKDMIIPCIQYARWMMWEQKERNPEKAARALQAFIKIMEMITGIPEKVIRKAMGAEEVS